MIAQMSLAILASVDLVAVQVDVVCQPHLAFSFLSYPLSQFLAFSLLSFCSFPPPTQVTP